MTEKKKLEIVFAPGCFDNFEGTQEELDNMIAEINQLVESGEIFERSNPLTEESFGELDEKIQIQLMEAMDFVDSEEFDLSSDRKLH
jgi:hypothetical protein